jgi:hypothetical protein
MAQAGGTQPQSLPQALDKGARVDPARLTAADQPDRSLLRVFGVGQYPEPSIAPGACFSRPGATRFQGGTWILQASGDPISRMANAFRVRFRKNEMGRPMKGR